MHDRSIVINRSGGSVRSGFSTAGSRSGFAARSGHHRSAAIIFLLEAAEEVEFLLGLAARSRFENHRSFAASDRSRLAARSGSGLAARSGSGLAARSRSRLTA